MDSLNQFIATTDELDLAYAVIDGVQARGQKGKYTTQRFKFNSVSSP